MAMNAQMTASDNTAGELTVTVPSAQGGAGQAGQIDATGVCAWFGGRLVLENVDLTMERRKVTALIGPSGCGKSTFLRILNRMHEVVPGAQLAGKVELDGMDIYAAGQRAMDTRRNIGMVFQKPNPFPSMTSPRTFSLVLSSLASRWRTRTISSRRCSPRADCGTR